MNTTELKNVTVTITMDEYERLVNNKALADLNDDLCSEIYNFKSETIEYQDKIEDELMPQIARLKNENKELKKAYNQMKISFDKERATTLELQSERAEREDEMLREHTARIEDKLEDINDLTWEVAELKGTIEKNEKKYDLVLLDHVKMKKKIETLKTKNDVLNNKLEQIKKLI